MDALPQRTRATVPPLMVETTNEHISEHHSATSKVAQGADIPHVRSRYGQGGIGFASLGPDVVVEGGHSARGAAATARVAGTVAEGHFAAMLAVLLGICDHRHLATSGCRNLQYSTLHLQPGYMKQQFLIFVSSHMAGRFLLHITFCVQISINICFDKLYLPHLFMHKSTSLSIHVLFICVCACVCSSLPVSPGPWVLSLQHPHSNVLPHYGISPSQTLPSKINTNPKNHPCLHENCLPTPYYLIQFDGVMWGLC